MLVAAAEAATEKTAGKAKAAEEAALAKDALKAKSSSSPRKISAIIVAIAL